MWPGVLTGLAYNCLMLFVPVSDKQLPDRYQSIPILPGAFVDKALTSHPWQKVRRRESWEGLAMHLCRTDLAFPASRTLEVVGAFDVGHHGDMSLPRVGTSPTAIR